MTSLAGPGSLNILLGHRNVEVSTEGIKRTVGDQSSDIYPHVY